MTTIPRTSSDLVQISRAEQRKQRLRDLETEQAAEEAEALKMTEEQRQILLKSFTSVKVEFTDLDGLRWSQAALHRFPAFDRNTPHFYPTSHATSKTNTFVVLTNADLANFAPEDTIRVSASTTKLHPRYSDQQATMPHPTTLFPESPPRYRDGNRSRSPIKGLFQSGSTHKSSDSYIHPIDMPYFESSDSSDRNVIPVADNGFITKHKQQGVPRGRRKLMGPPGLFPVESSESQLVSTGSGLKVSDSLKEQWPRAPSVADAHDFLSISTGFAPNDSLYHPPATPVFPKSPLGVHSFVAGPPRQIYPPRVRLDSIPPKPVPFPVEPATTPSPFLLSSATFGGGTGQDPAVAGDLSEDDDTPTTSPTTETRRSWLC